VHHHPTTKSTLLLFWGKSPLVTSARLQNFSVHAKIHFNGNRRDGAEVGGRAEKAFPALDT